MQNIQVEIFRELYSLSPPAALLWCDLNERDFCTITYVCIVYKVGVQNVCVCVAVRLRGVLVYKMLFTRKHGKQIKSGFDDVNNIQLDFLNKHNKIKE